MKYPYIVNKDGVWYPAGSNVPAGEKNTVNKEIEQVKNKDDFSKYMNSPKDNLTEKLVCSDYTKTDINRMSTADLKNLAKNENIKNADNISGADLKKILIEKFGL